MTCLRSTRKYDLDKKVGRSECAGMFSPEQCRAARAWLSWSQDELAKRANVSMSTVKDFERGARVPIGNNLTAMRNAIEAAGIGLIFGSSGRAVGIAVADPDGGAG
jgi:DNA-binding transcriptional regulator YiaG